MDMRTGSQDRVRRAPRSPLPRSNPLFARIAHWHDMWIARRTHANWRRELRGLDGHILDDIGLTYAMADEIGRRAQARDSEALRRASETTFPPQYDPGLAKLANHIET